MPMLMLMLMLRLIVMLMLVLSRWAFRFGWHLTHCETSFCSSGTDKERMKWETDVMSYCKGVRLDQSVTDCCNMVVLISIQKNIRIYSIWTNICIDNYMNILKYSKFCHTLCQMSVVDVSCRLQCSSSHSCASSWTSSFATARCKMHGARVNELVMCWYLRLIRIDQTKICVCPH